MKNIFLRHHSVNLNLTLRAAPEWKAQVDRWYQLDDPAFALAEAYFQFRPHLHRRPDFLFLASPAGSSYTDREFVKSGASSPSKFVHTLPNIRSAPLLQVMEWAGPLLCLQAASPDQTIVTALEEAALSASHAEKTVWLWSVQENIASQCSVHLFELSSVKNNMQVLRADNSAFRLTSDSMFLNWITEPTENNFALSPFFQLTCNKNEISQGPKF